MQISFGKIIPTVVYLDGKLADSTQRDKITSNLCKELRNDPGGAPTYLDEQQRRYFAAMVSDYRAPKQKFKAGQTEGSRVTTLNLNGKRYLVTGREIELKDELGRVYYKESNEPLSQATEDAIQLGITDEITQYNIQENIAAKKRRRELDEIRKSTTLNKTLYINAVKIPDKKTDRETYRIKLIDFKA